MERKLPPKGKPHWSMKSKQSASKDPLEDLPVNKLIYRNFIKKAVFLHKAAAPLQDRFKNDRDPTFKSCDNFRNIPFDR